MAIALWLRCLIEVPAILSMKRGEPVASEERGRGIKLMRMLVDNVEVARRTDGAGTRVQMVKLFSGALESCA